MLPAAFGAEKVHFKSYATRPRTGNRAPGWGVDDGRAGPSQSNRPLTSETHGVMLNHPAGHVSRIPSGGHDKGPTWFRLRTVSQGKRAGAG